MNNEFQIKCFLVQTVKGSTFYWGKGKTLEEAKQNAKVDVYNTYVWTMYKVADDEAFDALALSPLNKTWIPEKTKEIHHETVEADSRAVEVIEILDKVSNEACKYKGVDKELLIKCDDIINETQIG